MSITGSSVGILLVRGGIDSGVGGVVGMFVPRGGTVGSVGVPLVPTVEAGGVAAGTVPFGSVVAGGVAGGGVGSVTVVVSVVLAGVAVGGGVVATGGGVVAIGGGATGSTVVVGKNNALGSMAKLGGVGVMSDAAKQTCPVIRVIRNGATNILREIFMIRIGGCRYQRELL